MTRLRLLSCALAFFFSLILFACGGASTSLSPTRAPRVTADASAGEISPIPSSINFGNLQVSERKSFTETLGNSGKAALTISKIVALGAGFSFSGINPPETLSPGQTVTFAITYSPTVIGESRGTLAVESNASDSSLRIRLTGSAFLPGHLSVSRTSMNFGNVVIGSSRTETATLYASGGPVTVSATVSNGEFAIAGASLPFNIPSGGTASLKLIFSPQSPSTSAGVLALNNSGNDPVLRVPITGTGSPSSQHSATLDWAPSTSGSVIGYNVYRGNRSGGPYSRINSALDSSTIANDYNISPGQTYYYVVTAVNSDLTESAYSNEASAVIPSP